MAYIYCEPAECWEGCDDPYCPYIHIATWHREGDTTVYASHAEALAADNEAEDQAIIKMGDELTNRYL